MIISRSIDIAEYGINLFFFLAAQYSIVYMYCVSYSKVLYNTSVHRCLGCFRVLVTVNEMNIWVHYAKKFVVFFLGTSQG